MKSVRHLTDYQLQFIAQDCREAISANPDNPKVFQYLADKNTCQDEITRRDRIRIARKMIRETSDLLAWSADAMRKSCGLRYRLRTIRESYANSVFHNRQCRDGAWLIGWYRLNGMI
jgi:hypothetical protein